MCNMQTDRKPRMPTIANAGRGVAGRCFPLYGIACRYSVNTRLQAGGLHIRLLGTHVYDPLGIEGA